MEPEIGGRQRDADSTSGPDLMLRVVREVAARADVDPLSLPPFARSVDVAALKAILDRPGTTAEPGETRLSFQYAGYAITVEPSGVVAVDSGESVTADAV